MDVVREADAVVGALPGRLGFAMLEAVIRSGKPIADISFSPEDPLALDDLARERGVTAVVDCGVSPGISNFAVGRAAARFPRSRTSRSSSVVFPSTGTVRSATRSCSQPPT